MCHKTLIYGAENFLTPCTNNKQTKLFEILLKGEFQKNVYFYTPHTFYFQVRAN